MSELLPHAVILSAVILVFTLFWSFVAHRIMDKVWGEAVAMITEETLIEVTLADLDAMANRQARDTCMSVYIAHGEVWVCSRHKGHAGLHVDPSVRMPDARVGRYPWHRWITSTYTHEEFMAIPLEQRRVLV